MSTRSTLLHQSIKKEVRAPQEKNFLLEGILECDTLYRDCLFISNYLSLE